MTQDNRHVRLRDGSIHPASKFRVLPDGATFVTGLHLVDGAPADRATYLADTATLNDAQKRMEDAHGPGTAFLADLPMGEAGAVKRAIAEMQVADRSSFADAADHATQLASRLVVMADHGPIHSTPAEKAACRKASEYLNGMLGAGHAKLGDGAPASTSEGGYAAMCNHLDNAWKR